jgi:hypothetical protein
MVRRGYHELVESVTIEVSRSEHTSCVVVWIEVKTRYSCLEEQLGSAIKRTAVQVDRDPPSVLGPVVRVCDCQVVTAIAVEIARG